MIRQVEKFLDACTLTITFQKTSETQYLASIMPKQKNNKEIENIIPLIVKGTLDEVEAAIPEALERGIGYNFETIRNLAAFEESIKAAASKVKSTTGPKDVKPVETKKEEKPKETKPEEKGLFDTTDPDAESTEDVETAPFDLDKKPASDEVTADVDSKAEGEKAKRTRGPNKPKEGAETKPAEVKLTKDQRLAKEKVLSNVDKANKSPDADIKRFYYKEIATLCDNHKLGEEFKTSQLALIQLPDESEKPAETIAEAKPATNSPLDVVSQSTEDEEEDNPDEELQNDANEHLVTPELKPNLGPIDNVNEWL